MTGFDDILARGCFAQCGIPFSPKLLRSIEFSQES